ncbi:MAG: Mur ligase family protein [bacterium]|nr:Mur ligase family protein [bacterium]
MDVLKKVLITILTWEARIVLAKYKPHIIAVAGSVGKSTTKDAIYAVLAESLHVRKNERSFNGDIGVPLTILGCENGWKNPFKWLANIAKGIGLILIPQTYPEWLVLEVGADRRGDIQKIARWLKPDIVVLTAIPDIPAHVEFFESQEEMVEEKLSLAESLKPDGSLVLYGDDLGMMEGYKKLHANKITFGFENYNDFVASHDEIIYENEKAVGIRFRVNHYGSSVPISIFGILGRPIIYSGLAALVVGQTIGLDLVSISGALGKWAPPPRRLEKAVGAIVAEQGHARELLVRQEPE